MTSEEATFIVKMMEGNVHFFPRDEASQSMISAELISMGCTVDQGIWLARRYSQLYRKEWDFGELRALYCSRFKPADGVEVFSRVYEDGIPSDNPLLPMLPAAPVKQISGEVSVDPELDLLVRELGKPMAIRKPRTAEEIAAEIYKPKKVS